ncbi:MAG: hypothetical protein IJ716_14085 [Lachnospiraceae bacterium]|nr:hypothetical protein [Lachnospiraceae bacterium]
MRKKTIRKVQKEFDDFKCLLIRKGSKAEIFENCTKICFYSCMKEYFELNRKIPLTYLQIAYHINGFLDLAWKYFLKYEELRYDTWEALDGLMQCMMEHEWVRIITREERKHMMP